MACSGTGVIPRLLNRQRAATYLGQTLSSFARNVERALRNVRIKHAGKCGGVYYDREDLDRWVEEQKAKASPPVPTPRFRRPPPRRLSPEALALRERLFGKDATD